MKPLISVIVPVYNGAPYLAPALESVLAQPYDALEIIVIDDGSTDDSAAIVARFGQRVRNIYQANGGAGAARNHGVQLANGDFLAFLDQDDLWAPDKLAYQMEALLAEAAVDAVFGQVQQFLSAGWDSAKGTAIRVPAAPQPGLLPSALLIKRSSFLRVGLFGTDWRVGEWADWYARAKDSGLCMLMLPQLVAWRRIHAHNQGQVARASAHEYARLLKASLDRRRLAQRD